MTEEDKVKIKALLKRQGFNPYFDDNSVIIKSQQVVFKIKLYDDMVVVSFERGISENKRDMYSVETFTPTKMSAEDIVDLFMSVVRKAL